MDIREIWKEVGGDYDALCGNMGSERLVLKFAKRFAQDGTMDKLSQAMAENNIEDAKLHAHTLKGIALNMDFRTLAGLASELTENLRAGQFDTEGYEKVKAAHGNVLAQLEKLP